MFDKRQYVSFDVFDTCLIRRCGRPHKIWDLMVDRLFEKDDARGRLSFTGNRCLAEEKASAKTPFPTLKDIYDEMNVAQWGFNQDDVMNLEMEIEEQELFPNPEVLKTVNDFRDKEYKIAFISDMYLPTEFIKKILVKFNFCRDDEKIFVSADCKATKYSGKLYDFVLEKTKTNAKQWVHFGDNERSDYRVPKSKGVKANLISDTDFTDEEKRWLDNAGFYPHKHEIELWAGLCRLTRLQNEKSYAATMAVDFIASSYIPYVVYVLRTAKEKGIKTLYFLARDSRIFMGIAKSLKESEGIECRYLQLNRRVLYPCIFYNVDDYELELSITNTHYRTVTNALKYIGIEYASLSNATKKSFAPDFTLNGKIRRRNFAESLKANDADLLKKSALEKRGILLKYLEQEGLFNQKSAMVDLGWTGTCRCSVNYILRKEGFNTVPTFYFGYRSDLIYGFKSDLLFIYNRQYDFISKFSSSDLFFEKYASANPEGTVIAFEKVDDRIVPVEDEYDKSIEPMTHINEMCVKYFCKNLNLNNAIETAAFDEIFCLCGLNHVLRILSKPTKKDLVFFKDVDYEGYSVSEKMVRRLPLKDVLALCVWGIPASMIWAEAAIKVTFGPFAPLFVRFYKFLSQTAFANRLRLWWENRN